MAIRGVNTSYNSRVACQLQRALISRMRDVAGDTLRGVREDGMHMAAMAYHLHRSWALPAVQPRRRTVASEGSCCPTSPTLTPVHEADYSVTQRISLNCLYLL